MLTTHARSSNKKLIGGFLLLCLFGGLNSMARVEGSSTVTLLVATLAFLGGIVLWVRGCWEYAQGKGYPGAVGLIGLVLIGLIVLFLLPDQYKCCKQGGPECTHGRERAGPRSTKDWSSRAA